MSILLKILKVLLIVVLTVLAAFAVYAVLMFFAGTGAHRSKAIDRQSAFARAMCVVTAWIATTIMGVKMHMTGEDKLPKSGRFVFVCNHRSGFDPLSVIRYLRKYNISFISKPSNMELPLIGNVAYRAGYLPINRENDRAALRTILTGVDYLKRGVCSMGIYPEGTRSRTSELLPFHAGSFKLAQKAKVPLVIASTHGTENVMKSGPFRRTDVYLDILEVLPPEKLATMSTAEISAHTKGLIENNLKEE